MRRSGRRHRRLRRLAVVLAVAAAAGGTAGYLLYRAGRPATYRPGEELPEITSRLARGLPPDAPEPRFTDVTEAAGLGGFRTFAGPRSSQLPEDMGPGAAWGDFDNDGDDDLLLVAAGGALGRPEEELAPTELYENLGDGTFRRAAAFPDLRIHGMGAAWGDFDRDGWLDLAITGYGSLILLHNDAGRLARVAGFPEPEGFWAAPAWGDFDRDGDLDLYVCGYVRYTGAAAGRGQGSQQYGRAVPFTLNPAAFEPDRNLLFANDGTGSFSEVAQLYGVSNPAGRSLGALWHDFDDDGRLDLYIANDISDNALLLNRGETFEDVSLRALVADYRGAMGLAVGDWNRDGDDDLFITHWVAQENALYDSRLVDLRAGGSRPGGAPLPLSFADLSAPLGLGQAALPMVGWGTEMADFDGDGWLDIAVANGSTLESADDPDALEPQAPFLFWNRRGEHFHDLAPLSPALSVPHVARGLAVADYDLDGDLDLAIVHLGEGVQLLRNDMQSGHWLELRLRDLPRGEGGPPGFAEGAVAVAQVGEARLRRSITGASYLSQSSRTLHFGLGSADQVDALEVHWPDGTRESYGALAAGSLWEITRGSPPRRLPPRGGEEPGGEPDGGGPGGERRRIAEFWELQRQGMDALKRRDDPVRAEALFRQALALNPRHGDALYYLAACLAAQGRPLEALRELERLQEINPQSHRAFKRWGTLKAATAASDADLAQAQEAVERALALNPEETGSLEVLGEIALLRGDADRARRQLEAVCRTNPRSVGGLFLRAYLAWKEGDPAASRELLLAARAARGEDWKPEGAAAEGDVARRMHQEESPLARFWKAWDGAPEPEAAFREIGPYLRSRPPPSMSDLAREPSGLGQHRTGFCRTRSSPVDPAPLLLPDRMPRLSVR